MLNGRKKIFVQIASFRDSQLLPTLDDLFDKADEPDNLRVCICWQHSEEDEWDTLDKYQDDSRVKIIDVRAEDSKGVCWARNLIQQEYLFEEFTLQLDSHHRFVEGWDTELKNEILQLQLHGYKKPLLTGYISSFHPSLPKEEWAKDPWHMVFDRFTPDGVVFFSPTSIPNWKERTMPVRGRFYSAHFCFTLGSFCEEVQHDPRYYFHGEEIAIGVRAYTHGYDIFHPHKIVAYHEFSRDYRPDKHWDNYGNWTNHNEETYALMRGLLGIDGCDCPDEEKYGVYGLGTERTVADWEEYAGVRFIDRSLQQETIDGKLPPNDPDGDWSRRFKHCVDIHHTDMPDEELDFITVALDDEDGKTLYRKDITGDELTALLNVNEWCNIWIETNVSIKPKRAIVWPYSKDNGWLDKKTFDLP
ncbi:MAG: UDP-N-acetylglucosamine-transferase [Deltaproteobacteria bacterium]|jgi:hypothetical protein|nr:UDP-N-acetylglucosamine-transferase [Deltaproteobacteria bacterium]